LPVPECRIEGGTIMVYRVVPLFVAALVLALAAGLPVRADKEKDKDKDGTHEGKVVKAGDGKLTMTDKDGKKEHTHEVAKDATITCDGKKCKLEDLKAGFTVRVTTDKDGKVATKIEAKKSSKGS